MTTVSGSQRPARRGRASRGARRAARDGRRSGRRGPRPHRTCGSACRARSSRSCWRRRRSRSAAGRPRAGASGCGPATGRWSRPRPSARRSAGTDRGPRPRPSGARATGGPASTTSVGGKRSGAPVSAATSRASPTIERASPRFGLTSTSSTVSPYSAVSSAPSGVSAGRIRIPSASTVSPSSSPEQSIPLLTTPIFSVRSIRRSPGRTAPGSATGTRWPGAMFVAPQTISSGSPAPTLTRGQRQPVGARVLLDASAARRRRRCASPRPMPRCP